MTCGDLITCKDESEKEGITLRDHFVKHHPEMFTEEYKEKVNRVFAGLPCANPYPDVLPREAFKKCLGECHKRYVTQTMKNVCCCPCCDV